jgi:hypothetical protein
MTAWQRGRRIASPGGRLLPDRLRAHPPALAVAAASGAVAVDVACNALAMKLPACGRREGC